ncbi:MAG: hypothetical protein K8R58_09670 [Bacteroidales bacterium]|nr:hypothetical protein [Bacteroidales bacterium]
MKKTNLILLMLLFGFSVIAQETLTFRFANPMFITPTEFQFDIEIKASTAGTHQRDIQVYFDYNKSAFGENINTNNKIKLTKLDLLKGEIDGNAKYNIVKTKDINSSRLAFFTEFNPEITSPVLEQYNEVPVEFAGFMRVQIQVKDNKQFAGIKFYEDLMNGGQYYIGDDSKPQSYTEKCLYENDLLKESLDPSGKE